MGKPLKLYFASATIYDFNKLDAEGDTACINVGASSDTFSVVYLNAVRITNLVYINRAGSFTISGGLPEYNGSNYKSITITKNSNLAVTGTVTGALTNNGNITFTVPEDGAYTITVTDGVSCDATAKAVFPTVVLKISDEQVTMTGDTACVSVTTTGFTNVANMQLYMTYNPALVRYVGIKTVNLAPFTVANNINFSRDTPQYFLD